MNPQHLRAFVWLRWRLFVNQIHRGGIANQVVLFILGTGLALAAFGLFVGAILVGLLAFDNASATALMFVWDGLVLAFLVSWAIGLLAELQRSEALSIDKFLHLPVSISGVFLLNYLSSLVSFNLVAFLPIFLGLAVGLVFARGAAMLLLLPLIAAFMLMVTAVTHQFQGWLASLMVNKRQRRTVIVVVTLLFLLIFQLPALANMFIPWHRLDVDDSALKAARNDLKAALDKGEIDPNEFTRRQQELAAKAVQERYQRNAALLQQTEWMIEVAHLALPIGWLPYGARSLADHSIWPAPLCALGMMLLGMASLRRAYRTTVRIYTGNYTAGKQPVQPVTETAPTSVGRAPSNWLEKSLPWLSEPAAVIALGGSRSLTRAPEAKILLMSPIFLLVVFGGAFFREPIDMPIFVRPAIAFGAMSIMFFTMAQIACNQFGFDRGGFRIFVLSPTPRRDILLGKNLAVAPLAMILAVVMVILVEIIYPMRIDHLLALLPQWVSMLLLFCMAMNFPSILAPVQIAQGSFKPVTLKLLPALVRFLFVSVVPFLMALTLIPLAIEFGLETMEWIDRLPIFLVLSLVECAGVICVYRLVLNWQGALLQGREQTMLDEVTSKSE